MDPRRFDSMCGISTVEAEVMYVDRSPSFYNEVAFIRDSVLIADGIAVIAGS